MSQPNPIRFRRTSRLPGWRLERHGEGAELRLTGDWIARDSGVRGSTEVRRIIDEAGGLTLRVDASELGQWDSALIAFLKLIGDSVPAEQTRSVRIDASALPQSAQRLLALASAGAGQAPDIKAPHASLATRVGESCLRAWSRTVRVAALVGETALRGTAAFARWSVADGVSRQTLSSEQTSLVEPIGGAGDRAIVTAMSHAVEDLAERVAAGIERPPTNGAGAAGSETERSQAARCAAAHTRLNGRGGDNRSTDE